MHGPSVLRRSNPFLEIIAETPRSGRSLNGSQVISDDEEEEKALDITDLLEKSQENAKKVS